MLSGQLNSTHKLRKVAALRRRQTQLAADLSAIFPPQARCVLLTPQLSRRTPTLRLMNGVLMGQCSAKSRLLLNTIFCSSLVFRIHGLLGTTSADEVASFERPSYWYSGTCKQQWAPSYDTCRKAVAGPDILFCTKLNCDTTLDKQICAEHSYHQNGIVLDFSIYSSRKSLILAALLNQL